MKSLSTDKNKKTFVFSKSFSDFSAVKLLSLIAVFSFFIAFAFIIKLIFADVEKSDAATVSAQAGSSVYYASISNNDTVTIPITPTSTQTVYSSSVNDSKITFSSTCPKGAYVYINTSSASNNLTRTGTDTGLKTIPSAVTGTSLNNNSWGFSTNGGTSYKEVPVSGSPATLYTSTNVETNTAINLQYGVKVDNNIPSGTYTNDVVYTVAVKPECLAYTLKFDTQGGSSISDASINYGDTVNLNNYATSRSGYIFGGWSNGTSDFTGKETTANPNPSNNFTVTLSACWVKNTPYAYGYTGSAQTFTAPCNGYYKMEAWGGSGGNGETRGGYGAYVSGQILLAKNKSLSLYVAGQGTHSTADSTSSIVIVNGGYNGGGNSAKSSYGYNYKDSGGSGGGATDIRVSGGTLNSRIIVAAGGGGGVFTETSFTQEIGGDAGGLTGTNGVKDHRWTATAISPAQGGNQTNYGANAQQDSSWEYTTQTNGGFGFAGGMTDGKGYQGGGGGSGWYGGGAGTNWYCASGGGGSSYISGHTGSVAVASTSSSSPKSGCTTGTTNNTCSISPYINPATNSGYTFTNTLMIDGAGYKWTNTKGGLQQMPKPSGGYYASGVGHSGNGYAKITYLGPTV